MVQSVVIQAWGFRFRVVLVMLVRLGGYRLQLCLPPENPKTLNLEFEAVSWVSDPVAAKEGLAE